MEIIQTYTADDDTDVCVVSDGSTIYFADKNDLDIESATVGSVVRPSQLKEHYLEIPKEMLQEAARRSEIAVDPDPEEDSDDDSEDDSTEEEDAPPPDWRPIARERFLRDFSELDRGVSIRVLTPINVRVRWVEDEHADWRCEQFSTLEDIMENHETLQSNLTQMTMRIENYVSAVRAFADEQRALGHEISDMEVEEFIEAEHSNNNNTQQQAAE